MIGMSNVTPKDMKGVWSLLALISDPAAAKAVLEQIEKAETDAEAAIAKAAELNGALTEAAKADREAAARMLEEASTKLGDAVAANDKSFREAEARTKALDARDADLKRAEAALADRKREFEHLATQWEGSRVTAEDALKARETALDAKAAEVDAREAAVAEKERAYEQRVAALDALLTPLNQK